MVAKSRGKRMYLKPSYRNHCIPYVLFYYNSLSRPDVWHRTIDLSSPVWLSLCKPNPWNVVIKARSQSSITGRGAHHLGWRQELLTFLDIVREEGPAGSWPRSERKEHSYLAYSGMCINSGPWWCRIFKLEEAEAERAPWAAEIMCRPPAGIWRSASSSPGW